MPDNRLKLAARRTSAGESPRRPRAAVEPGRQARFRSMRAASDLVQASLLMVSVLVAELGCVEGRVAFELLPDPSVTTPTVSGRQVLMAPVPLEEPLPEYPEQALVNDAAPVSVAVRIIIDETGVVREVLDSPLDQRPIDDNRGVYRDAIEEAVWRWRFNPATIRTLADGESSYSVTVDERPVRSYLDLRFTFEVVSGRGRVLVGPSK